MSITEAPFGSSACGKPCTLFTLKNESGIQVTLTDYAASLVSLYAHDRHGSMDNICLTLDSIEAYEAQRIYIGAVVGRYANRIANACYQRNGDTYHLAANLGKHSLHGGKRTIGQRVWRLHRIGEYSGEQQVEFAIESSHGDNGFPGNLDVRVCYTLTEDNRLIVDFFAETDVETPVSLTHHAYFNLSGARFVAENPCLSSHRFEVFSDRILDVDDELVPTGKYRSVSDTLFDFRQSKKLTQYLKPLDECLKNALGFDHNYCFEPWCDKLKKMVSIYDEQSGRSLTVSSTMPGAQLYTGNYLFDAGFENHSYFCVEPQFYPDSPNHDHFPFLWCLPDRPYKHRIEWQLLLGDK